MGSAPWGVYTTVFSVGTWASGKKYGIMLTHESVRESVY